MSLAHAHAPRYAIAAGLFLCAVMHGGAAIAGPITDFATWSAGAAMPRTTVTFDDRTAFSTLAGTEYAGLTITQRDAVTMVVVAVNSYSFLEPGNFNSGGQGLASSWGTDQNFTNASDNLDFRFAAPTRSAGLWVGNLWGADKPTVVEFLGSNDTVLDSIAAHDGVANHVGMGYVGRLFVGLNLATADIAAIRVFNAAGNSDGIVIDDVTFSSQASTPVPEPATLAFVATGLAGLLVGRRR